MAEQWDVDRRQRQRVIAAGFEDDLLEPGAGLGERQDRLAEQGAKRCRPPVARLGNEE